MSEKKRNKRKHKRRAVSVQRKAPPEIYYIIFSCLVYSYLSYAFFSSEEHGMKLNIFRF